MSYDGLRPGPSLGSGSQEFECWEGCEEVEIIDIHTEPGQLQDHHKDQSEELVEFNLKEEERRLNLLHQVSLFPELKKAL